MRQVRDISMMIAMILSLIMFCVIPAEGKSLTTVEAGAIDVPGTFTLILYGGSYSRDVENLALLDLEGDPYTLEPYAPEFDYRVIRGLSAKDALDLAEHFLSSQYAFRRSLLSRILDSSGKTIGYELKPFYDPLTVGLTDVLDVSYEPRKDGKVRVYIRLNPSVQRQISGGDGPRDDGR